VNSAHFPRVFSHSLWVLCKLGQRMAQMEAEVSYIGMCLRHKYVDPTRFGHLASMQVGWHRKKRILNDYRDGTRDQLRTVSLLCDQLWSALLGGNFCTSSMFTQWLALKKMDYDVAFRTLRLRICSRRRSNPVLSSALSVLKKVVNPCDVQLSKPTERILANGLKFCVNIKPSRMDIVSAIHTVSSAVSDPAEKTALMASSLKKMSDLVDDSFKSDRRDFGKIASVKKELDEKEVVLLETDKSGVFSVLPMLEFRRKSDEAMAGLFRPFDGCLKKYKREIVRVCKDADLAALTTRINNVSKDTFGIKFFLKDHKVDLPLRVVINENRTWQKIVSSFLQKTLTILDTRSPLSLRCSDDLVADLQPFHGKRCTIFSLDIKYLYYSLEPKTLLARVSSFLEEHLVSFQSQSGISVQDVLGILEVYLGSTVVQHNGHRYIQQQGVCIGSAVAPALSDIYLRDLDLRLLESFKHRSPNEILVRRYVDDILVCSTDGSLADSLEKVVFEAAPELKFSLERPNDDRLQYLDVQLRTSSGLCWEYGKVASKPLLPFNSCHSKHVKLGINRNLVNSTVQKSCSHFIGSSFRRLTER
ncbi:unnamed protein product, partial [Ixodes pacificus]